MAYERELRRFLAEARQGKGGGGGGGGLSQLGLDLSRASEEARRLLELARSRQASSFLPLSPLWTPCGYLLLTRMRNFLGLACDFPGQLGLDRDLVDGLRLANLRKSIQELLMHSPLCDIT